VSAAREWLQLQAAVALRQRSRHRQFRFRCGLPRRGGLPVGVRARHGAFACDLALRPATSDRRVFEQVFLEEQYDVAKLARWRQLRGAAEAAARPPLVLDLGANIGLASLFFAHLLPRAEIVAVEPEAANFARLESHLAPLGRRAQCLRAAASGRDGSARVVAGGGATASFRTEPVAGGGGGADVVPACTVPSLLAGRAEAAPFLLKCDIEGAERELFSGDVSWLDEFAVVMVEPHDWMLPGEARARPLLQALAARERELAIVGESLVSIAASPA